MSDFSQSWALSRQRFVDTISDLNDVQLNWRIHPNALSIAQMAVHVAGVEISFGTQLLGVTAEGEDARIKAAATDGVVNDKPFPYADGELTAGRVREILEKGRAVIGPIIAEPSRAILEKELVSALGPVITGQGAFARLGFHAGYHQGQAYLMRTAPNFPA